MTFLARAKLAARLLLCIDSPSESMQAAGVASAADFERSFSLSESIDAERITAELEHGVLKVSLPKRPMLSGQTQFEIPVRTDRG